MVPEVAVMVVTTLTSLTVPSSVVRVKRLEPSEPLIFDGFSNNISNQNNKSHKEEMSLL
jgi:hypothetical protein